MKSEQQDAVSRRPAVPLILTGDWFFLHGQNRQNAAKRFTIPDKSCFNRSDTGVSTGEMFGRWVKQD